MTQADELLPCPFCGELPTAGFEGGTDQTGEHYGYHFIECKNKKCRCHEEKYTAGHYERFIGVHGDELSECIAAWNTRTPHPDTAAVKAAVEALEFYATSWVKNSNGSADGDPGKRLLSDKGHIAREALRAIGKGDGK